MQAGSEAEERKEGLAGAMPPGAAMAEASPPPPPAPVPPKRKGRRRRFSPLTRRILAINVLAPLLLVAALLYLDQYRAGLLDATVLSLDTQGQLIAGALAESAVSVSSDKLTLDPYASREILRRLAAATDSRVRLFSADGHLMADSESLLNAGRHVVLRPLAPPPPKSFVLAWAEKIYDRVIRLIPSDEDLPLYVEHSPERASDYDEITLAMQGDDATELRRTVAGDRIVSVAVPVQSLRKIMGVLLLTVDSSSMDAQIRSERLVILKFFFVILAVTVLLSLFLASTIARPVRRLAAAAERVRTSHGRQAVIPDFSARRDEIGELSGSLRDMTDELYRRMDAIEAFAADVAHEIKNPLTSLRSAVETLERAQDPDKRRRLLEVIGDDVQRLDRLISDISNASRLDAELSRAESEPVDLARLLEAVVKVHDATAAPGAPALVLDLPPADRLTVSGLKSRLGQVVRNLVDNAISFSPPGAAIRILAWRAGTEVRFAVEDDGPGMPEHKLEAVFDRFYSERPAGEQFGTHSGLGLSISRQIVEAHGGRIRAENRRDAAGRVMGARFVVTLPAA